MSCFVLNPNVLIERFEDDEAVAFDTVTRNTYLLNKTALFALECFGLNGNSYESAESIYCDKCRSESVTNKGLQDDFKEAFDTFLGNMILLKKN